MAKDEVQLKKTDSVFDELARLHETISRRAYDLFLGRDAEPDPLGDWFQAERELVLSPLIDVRQNDGEFEIEASVAGVDPKDVDVQVTPQDILIKGRIRGEQEKRDAKVHVSELRTGQVFRAIHLPDPIDPDSVKAEYRNGLLHLRAKIATAAPKKIVVQAA